MYLSTPLYNPDNLKDRVHTPYLTFLENALFPLNSNILELCLYVVTRKDFRWTRKNYNLSKDFFDAVNLTANNIKVFIHNNSKDKYITKAGVVQQLAVNSDYSSLGDDLHTFENGLFELIKLQDKTQQIIKKLNIKKLDSLFDTKQRQSYVIDYINKDSGETNWTDETCEVVDWCEEIVEAFEDLNEKLSSSLILQHQFRFLNEPKYYNNLKEIMGGDFSYQLYIRLSTHKTIDFQNKYSLSKELLVWLSKNIILLENQKYEQVLRKIISLQNHAGFSHLLNKIESLITEDYAPKTLIIYCNIFEKTSKIIEHNKETIEKFFKLGISPENLCLYNSEEISKIGEFNTLGFSSIQLMKEQKSYQEISFQYYTTVLKNLICCIFNSEILSSCKKLFENMSKENAEETYYTICSSISTSGIEGEIQQIKELLSKTNIEKEKKLFILQVLYDNFGKNYLEIYNTFSCSELKKLYEIFLGNKDLYNERSISEAIGFLKGLLHSSTDCEQMKHAFGMIDTVKEKILSISKKYNIMLDDIEEYLQKYSSVEQRIVLKKIDVIFANLKESQYGDVELVIFGDSKTIDEIIRLQSIIKNFQEVGVYNFDYDFIGFCIRNYKLFEEKISILKNEENIILSEIDKINFLKGEIICDIHEKHNVFNTIRVNLTEQKDKQLLSVVEENNEEKIKFSSKETQEFLSNIISSLSANKVSSTVNFKSGKGSGRYSIVLTSLYLRKFKKSESETDKEYLIRILSINKSILLNGDSDTSRNSRQNVFLDTIRQSNISHQGFYYFMSLIPEILKNVESRLSEKSNLDNIVTLAKKATQKKEVLI